MGVTQNYNRPKNPKDNVTGMAITLFADEGALPTLADLAGDDANLHAEWRVDVDESVGVAVLPLFGLVATIDVTSGVSKLTLVVTPKKGDGSGGHPSKTLEVVHPETMDAFQTAGGRPQQP